MFGLDTTLQVVPSQCSVTVVSPVYASTAQADPTAQASVEEMATTPLRRFSPVLAFGLGRTLHAVPSQCSVSVRMVLGPTVAESYMPAAQMSVADTADMPVR